jgi:hypothetical protein
MLSVSIQVIRATFQHLGQNVWEDMEMFEQTVWQKS